MRKLMIILLLAVGTSFANAQGKFDPNKFKANLHRYIVTEAKLTQAEADKFFPLYDEMKDKQRALHRQMRDCIHQKPATDAACKSAITKHDNLDIQMKQLERSYHEKFMKVLSPTKLYDVLKAEMHFHKKTFQNEARKR